MLFRRLRIILADLIAPESLRNIERLEQEQKALWSDLDFMFHGLAHGSPTRWAIGWALVRAGYFDDDEDQCLSEYAPHEATNAVIRMEAQAAEDRRDG